jgi:hypothetical protein
MLTTARKANIPWNSFKTSLITTFRPIYKDFDLRNRINHLKDNGNFMEYLYEFRLLSNQVQPSDMSEKDRYMCFVQGLQPRTSAVIFMRNITDLEGAIEKAPIIENARNMEKDEKSKVSTHEVIILSLTSGGLRGKREKRNRNEQMEKAGHAKNEEATDKRVNKTTTKMMRIHNKSKTEERQT